MFLSIRDELIKLAGFDSLYGGLRELEIESYELHLNRQLENSLGVDLTSDARRKELLDEIEGRKISVCAVLLDNDFSEENLEGQIDYVVKGCQIASGLGVDVVRTNALMREISGFTLDQYVERTIHAVSTCISRIEGLDICLAIENHGVIANRHEFLRRVFDEMPLEKVGLTLDTGNFYWFGYPLEQVYEIVGDLAPYVKHTHLKNATTQRKNLMRKPREVSMSPLRKGDLDLAFVIKTLKEAGYDRDITIEDESLSKYSPIERRGILKEDASYLLGLLRQ